jgi:hypothetical protein
VVLAEYFERLDGPEPERALDLLATDFRFATLWGEGDVARPSSGGVAELREYLASRDADGQRHHVLQATTQDGVELAAGYTTRHGAPLASFLITIHLDASGRIRRMLAARTTALSLLD